MEFAQIKVVWEGCYFEIKERNWKGSNEGTTDSQLCLLMTVTSNNLMNNITPN